MAKRSNDRDPSTMICAKGIWDEEVENFVSFNSLWFVRKEFGMKKWKILCHSTLL